MNESDAKQVLRLYAELKECKDTLLEVPKAEFRINMVNAFNSCPISKEAGTAYFNSHYGKRIKEITEQLDALGFSPDGTERPSTQSLLSKGGRGL